MNNINIVCLGGASEVGRSCVIIESANRSIMLDCGIHPAFMGIGCLPIYDAYDISKVDLCLITHFHMDHSGALPYLINRTRFKGKVYMTEATKSICYLLWNDYARIEKCMHMMNKMKGSRNKNEVGENETDEYGNKIKRGGVYSSDEYGSEDNEDDDYYQSYICEMGDGDIKHNVLYDENDINVAMKRIETLNFHEHIEFEDVKFTAYRAGHVIGACMFLVEINNIRFLYTGDYSREVDRHIPIAEIPTIDVHVLICEGTYGIRVHDDRKKREVRFLNMITSILNNKGKVLLPVFALGRAQELLLIMEEHWEKNTQLQKIPIFYISSMATKSLCIYETFINLCGDFVRHVLNEGKNPFNFKYVKYAKSLDSILNYLYQDNNPCVVMASPGMLQNGISKNIFNIIAPDKKSGVILTGYTVKGTLAHELKTEPEYVLINDKPVKRRCRFEEISFSAHSDFNQTKTFIEKLKCPNVVLVHGDRNELNRLKNKLTEEKKYLSVFTPELLQRLTFRFEHSDHVVSLGQISQHIRYLARRREVLQGKELDAADEINVVRDANRGDAIDAAVAIDATDATGATGEKGKEQSGGRPPPEANTNRGGEKLSDRNGEEKTIPNGVDAIIISEPKAIPIMIYAKDIYEYTNLKTALIDQTISIKFPHKFELLYHMLRGVYEETHMEDGDSGSGNGDKGGAVIFVQDVKIHYCSAEKVISINWLSSPVNDLVADSINFLILEFLDTMKNNNHLSICNEVTDDEIYEMIISYVKENYTNVERFSKVELKRFLLENSSDSPEKGRKEEAKDAYEDGLDNLKNDQSYSSGRINQMDHNKMEEEEVDLCEDHDEKSGHRDRMKKFRSLDKILFDYIAADASLAMSTDEEEPVVRVLNGGMLYEILKFEVKDNNNKDVNVYVDIDNREVICEEVTILLKIREILKNIEESLLPMCF
ncbi:cleavage and polyadenylation specificity factor, putative [Plasmodium knowlesi strain H]|uniref:Cleavage and polyadenylation specificity factor, putative n=3 Tax=Plasmodium knowlesi TaxID=5850 RepID=A0A5K1URD6_PLAKH|nr:cleavage and polyadenylation specificity factor subunit 3, putative [Plasmodium knowlesi strain H]OTN65637.1 putative Cleavage and polyadenylation specificity factor [Plasmodium knowlesi]CAA9989766.1 cleavage and polyadenylation specificity factor subunit 3, putative [Plasmodium knowlesi strain H]SBO22940.1 cleavage and polyadenylation specificity factor, putative [Plasmodium knowlesi strain H]SBO22958.1 cleavage and polyadenylation specificity factor, putative [Plasmodium knowlesi strain H]|eukprot:XP_002260489.1 cleavage and polyadenylation specifity protein,putative [Plasmodium knowlesi strain H]